MGDLHNLVSFFNYMAKKKSKNYKTKVLENSIDDDLIVEKDPSGFVTMEEAIQMKVMRMQGLPDTSIAKKIGRGNHTVGKILKNFESLLPEDVDLKNKVADRFEEITERHLRNAEIICKQADEEVSKKISHVTTTAVDAARIRQIYGNILNVGLGQGKLGDDESGNNPTVINFINTIVNIQNKQKDDRLTTTPRAKRSIGKNEQGGKETCVEGTVS